MTERSASADGAREIVRVCRRLYERGLISGPEGNVSVRLDGALILATPAGMSKTDVTEDDLVTVDLDGNVKDGRRRPSSELRMHLRIYRSRPDVAAVVHAHPPTATGFGVAGESFVAPVLPEVIFLLGEVPLVRYATPGTEALADSIEPYLSRYDAFLLANHGATTVGASLEEAHQRMEILENAAKIVLTARLLGRVNELSADDVAALLALRALRSSHEEREDRR